MQPEEILIYMFLGVVVIIISLFKFDSTYNRKLNIYEKDLMIKTDITEDPIKYLDQHISNAIDEYQLLELTIKDIEYISTDDETIMRNWLVDEIPKRISATVMLKLETMYNSEYIGELIGRRIYLAVSEFVLEYNIKHMNEK